MTIATRRRRIWRHCAVIFPVVQRGLFVAPSIRGWVARNIPADRAVEADDLLVVVEERRPSRVPGQYTDDVRHSGDYAIAQRVIFVNFGQCGRGGFYVVACRGWFRQFTSKIIAQAQPWTTGHRPRSP